MQLEIMMVNHIDLKRVEQWHHTESIKRQYQVLDCNKEKELVQPNKVKPTTEKQQKNKKNHPKRERHLSQMYQQNDRRLMKD